VLRGESTRPGILADVTRYFEDYSPGMVVDCGSVSLSETDIIAFAKEYDPQPFHTDPSFDSPYGGLIASGWHTISLVMRQLVDNFIDGQTSLGAAGVDEVRWPRPVRPGDVLRIRATVLETRRSVSKPDRGIVRTLIEAANQDGQVLRMTAINFIRARSSAPGGAEVP
jgi:acyl dehydratase